MIAQKLFRHEPPDLPPLPPVEALPRPPAHDPRYHALANRQTTLQLKARQWERERRMGRIVADSWREGADDR